MWLLPEAIRIVRAGRSEEIQLSELEAVAYRKGFGFAEILLESALEGRRVILFVPRMFLIPSRERPAAVETLAEQIANRGRSTISFACALSGMVSMRSRSRSRTTTLEEPR